MQKFILKQYIFFLIGLLFSQFFVLNALAADVSDIPIGVASRSEYFDQLKGTDNNNTIEGNLLPAVMQFMIGGIGGIATLVLFYSGVLMITSFGDSEKREKGKKMLYWSVLGIIFMLLAYAIVKGLTNLQFNQ